MWPTKVSEDRHFLVFTVLQKNCPQFEKCLCMAYTLPLIQPCSVSFSYETVTSYTAETNHAAKQNVASYTTETNQLTKM